MPDYSYEQAALESGFGHICGVDEAGRGPLAGPVCAAAVILPLGTEIEGLNDSKKLSEKKREQLFDIIIEKAVDYSIAYGSLEEIETHFKRYIFGNEQGDKRTEKGGFCTDRRQPNTERYKSPCGCRC